ncbi:Dynein assembly factor 1, axonemal [Hypsibius exemplaris]|uniref:Dynein assembly factor 1, axonemal n=1 Tax=Hypsibius exemplaris TaxID=2072580 RepID=A0A9X6NKE4_HYPEX|nr:Dynein assembly factor 1, axonemal [Hypsibius exemplaris]
MSIEGEDAESGDTYQEPLLDPSPSRPTDHGQNEATGDATEPPRIFSGVKPTAAPRMTKESLLKICRELKLYSTPALNDILYLNHRGFMRIENLDAYTGLRCIFLGSNGIQRIENFNHLTDLRSLFLQDNLISRLENLEGLHRLVNLNLSNNRILKIENLDSLPKLYSLELAHNLLATADDIDHLRRCSAIEILDLSHNRLDDPRIVDVLAAMPSLGVLNLTGNPVASRIPNYRKTLICRLKSLNHLDQNPVSPRDRACAEAWYRGGRETEMAERQEWITKRQRNTKESVRNLLNLRLAARQSRDTVNLIVQTVEASAYASLDAVSCTKEFLLSRYQSLSAALVEDPFCSSSDYPALELVGQTQTFDIVSQHPVPAYMYYDELASNNKEMDMFDAPSVIPNEEPTSFFNNSYFVPREPLCTTDCYEPTELSTPVRRSPFIIGGHDENAYHNCLPRADDIFSHSLPSTPNNARSRRPLIEDITDQQ